MRNIDENQDFHLLNNEKARNQAVSLRIYGWVQATSRWD